MRKGTKILVKALSTTILLMIILPILLSLLLDIRSIQNYAIQKATKIISESLQTKVSIDRIDLTLFNKVKLKGFYVEDYQRDTLLYVGRLDANLIKVGLFGGGLEFRNGDFSDAKLYLRETPDGILNIKQVLNRINRVDPNKPKNESNFKLKIEQVSIRDFDVSIERQKHRNPSSGVDFGNMQFKDVAINVNKFNVSGTTIYTDIGHLSGREISGFELEDFTGRFYLSSGCIGFEDLRLKTEKSSVHLPYMSLVGSDWTDYSDFISKVLMDGSFINSRVDSDDVAYFSPSLKDWGLVVEDVALEFSGTVDNLSGKITRLKSGEVTELVAGITIKGLPDIKKSSFDIDLKKFRSNITDIATITSGIGKKTLSKGVFEVGDRVGVIDLTGRFVGSISSFNVNVAYGSEVGRGRCNFEVEPIELLNHRVKGEVVNENIDLGRILNNETLGSTSFTTLIDGLVSRGGIDLNAVVDVSNFEYLGYGYDSIVMDGRFSDRLFSGEIIARDKALSFDFDGLVDFNESIPRYDFSMALLEANLVDMNINTRDSVSLLKGNLRAVGIGSSLDDLYGTIFVSDATYNYNDKEIHSEQLKIYGENSEDSKFVELTSDFANATFRSKSSYHDVIEYLKGAMGEYLPVLSSWENPDLEASRQIAVVDDYSLFSLNVKDINPVVDAITAGLQIAKDTKLQLLFNPYHDKLSLQLNSDYIEQDQMLATRLSVNIGNRGDSLTMYASAEDFYLGGVHLPTLSVTGGARAGAIKLYTAFRDTTNNSSGSIGLWARSHDSELEGRYIDLRFEPSHLKRNKEVWNISSKSIRIDTAKIDIDNFIIKNRDQMFKVDGIASRSRQDSVVVDMSKFNISPFTQFIEKMGYTIAGVTNGRVTMQSVFRDGIINANIDIDSIKVNELDVPSLVLNSNWNIQDNRAAVFVQRKVEQDTLIRGYYNPSSVAYSADINIENLEAALLDPILAGVISSTKGVADVDLTLRGQGRNANLAGRIEVSDFETLVDYTMVKYSMKSATIDVKDNILTSYNVPIVDHEGGDGLFDLTLNLDHISNISYDIKVSPSNMLVMDTDSKDNELFYGKVYATGVANISGDKQGVDMDITAISEDNSYFNMPLSDKANISKADFVTFKKPIIDGAESDLERKKRLFERHRAKKTASAGNMNINLSLDVRPNLEFQLMIDPETGNVIKGRGAGTLDMNINPKTNTFQMYGDYTITEGIYFFSLNFITKKFIIDEGSTLQWNGSPMDAMLNIDAIYKLKTSLQPLLQGESNTNDRSVPVDCVIYLRDELTSPDVSFDVKVPSADTEIQAIVANALNTPELKDTQFLYLVFFNSFLGDSFGASDFGASASAATGLEFLTSQLSNLLSADDYNIVLRYRPKSDLTSDEVDFGLSKSLINDRLFVEIGGNYAADRKAVDDNDNPFMGEAYVTWLIDRAGALKLKGFTQTIDSFGENQGLQETGIGIYFKEDFNNFKDFRARIKRRFTSDKRRKKKEQKRLQRDSLEGLKVDSMNTSKGDSNVNEENKN